MERIKDIQDDIQDPIELAIRKLYSDVAMRAAAAIIAAKPSNAVTRAQRVPKRFSASDC